MRLMGLACALAWGMTASSSSGSPAAPEAEVQAQQAGGWLGWWAEGHKAARQTGKPIFMVFR